MDNVQIKCIKYIIIIIGYLSLKKYKINSKSTPGLIVLMPIGFLLPIQTTIPLQKNNNN